MQLRLWRKTAIGAAMLVVALAGVRLAPKPPLRDLAPSSTALYAEDGTLLRLTLAPDQQYRLWVPLQDIAAPLIEAVTLYEDRWFAWHPGVNPAALVRSGWASATGERQQGGSTLTMQLARRAYRIDSRSITGKLKQIAAALWIEARYSKRDILEAYLNLAPYGGNIEGVGAASLVYFSKRAADLTVTEALTLAVIPQNPRARGPRAQSIERLSVGATVFPPLQGACRLAGRHRSTGEPHAARIPCLAPNPYPGTSGKALICNIPHSCGKRGETTQRPKVPGRKPTAHHAVSDSPGGRGAFNFPLPPGEGPRVRENGGAHLGNPNNEGRTALSLARERLLNLWLEVHAADRDRSLAAPPIKTLAQLPFRAPHLVNQLLASPRSSGGAAGEVWTSLHPKMQATLERSVAQYVERHQAMGLRNASAILVDSTTMQVKALVGSANFQDASIDGQVNGVLAKRSPGSTLKPFIYALGIDQGLLHPMTVLKDAPTAFGPFSPENFDGRFVGPISAQEALVRSRNVPAVAVAAKLSRPTLYDWLLNAGVSRMASEQHYGLALALGGGEVTLEEMARLYAVLARGGELRALSYEARNEIASSAPRVLSEEAAFITLDMLRTNPRPDTGAPARPAVAWKTGTSWGFRDAWTAGVFGRYVLVVWVGNFDGSSNPAFIGVQAAAPLFFLMVDALRSQGLEQPGTEAPTPAGLTHVEVCRATGDLPNAYCPERALTWFIPGKSPIRLSTLHRRVLIDARTGAAVCDESPTTHWEVREFWTPDMLRLFREAGLPRREAPHLPQCLTRNEADAESAPRILSPHRGLTYVLRLSNPTALALNANAARGKQYWFAGNAFIGETTSGQALAWLPPGAGQYQLSVVDEMGRSDRRELRVEVVP